MLLRAALFATRGLRRRRSNRPAIAGLSSGTGIRNMRNLFDRRKPIRRCINLYDGDRAAERIETGASLAGRADLCGRRPDPEICRLAGDYLDVQSGVREVAGLVDGIPHPAQHQRARGRAEHCSAYALQRFPLGGGGGAAAGAHGQAHGPRPASNGSCQRHPYVDAETKWAACSIASYLSARMQPDWSFARPSGLL